MARNYYKETKITGETWHRRPYQQHNTHPSIKRSDCSNRYNINTALVSYATSLQYESTPHEQQYNHAPKHAFKRNANVSYDVDNEGFPPRSITRKKNNRNHRQWPSLPYYTQHIISIIRRLYNSIIFQPRQIPKTDRGKANIKIETSYNQEIKEQLQLNNTALMSTISQRFRAFQTVILQIVKGLVHLLVISANQNNTN